jgi:hypothetical protein
MNTLLDRYLSAIGRELPMRQSDEITAELRDVLMSKIEDREGDLGRPLTDKELEQLLIDFGHPLVVAAGYRKTPYLIGPELFPMWVATMRFILVFWAAITLVSLFIAAVANPATAPGLALQKAAETIWPGFVWIFGVVTMVFAFNERMGKYRFKLHFNPRQLPPARGKGRKPAEIVTQIVLGAVALAWWAGLIRFRSVMPMPAFLDVRLASTWDVFRAPIAAYFAIEILINGLELARPAWVKLSASLGLAKHAAGAAIVALVLQTGHWVHISGSNLAPGVREMIEQGFDHGLRVGLVVTLAVMMFMVVKEALRLWKALGGNGPAGNGASAAAAHG